MLSVRCRHHSVKSRGPALEMRGVVVQARAFVYLLFQLTKNADSYGIVLGIGIDGFCVRYGVF